MNESTNNCESKIKLCEKVPSMFIKNKTKKKKVDVWLNKCLDDKDVIRYVFDILPPLNILNFLQIFYALFKIFYASYSF